MFCGVWFSSASDDGRGQGQPDCSAANLTERDVLIRLYKATGGPEGNWIDATHWGSARPLAEWYGVYVDEAGKVESLILAGNGLEGVVPECLGMLASLTTLDLMGNRLLGTIPAELGTLANLGFLNLSHNRLTGRIPAELACLMRLRVLYLNHNRLTGTASKGLGELPMLEVLHLANNQLRVPLSDKWCRISDRDFVAQGAAGDT